MQVLVTGASGFLGRWVTRALVDDGHDVRVLVRRADRLADLRELDLAVIEGDVLARDTVARATRGARAIVHCAGAVSLKPREQAMLYRTNLEGTRNVLEMAAARDLRVLHVSSIAAVGPSREATILDEASPREELDFEYSYAASKRDSEDLALAYAAAGLDVVVLNPGIMLGPDDLYLSSTEFVMRYLRSQLGVHLAGGSSFCDVRDVALAFPAALSKGRRGERYILAGVNRRYGEVLEELRGVTGLQRSTRLPRLMAEWVALWSEIGAAAWEHPLEKFNLGVVRWGSLFNFCAVEKAQKELGYRNRDFTQTLTDTVVDHLRRKIARPVTPRLRQLLERAESANAAPLRRRRRNGQTRAR